MVVEVGIDRGPVEYYNITVVVVIVGVALTDH